MGFIKQTYGDFIDQSNEKEAHIAVESLEVKTQNSSLDFFQNTIEKFPEVIASKSKKDIVEMFDGLMVALGELYDNIKSNSTLFDEIFDSICKKVSEQDQEKIQVTQISLKESVEKLRSVLCK